MLNPMCRRIFQSVSLWLLMPALILPAGPAWAVPERNYAAETLAAPLTLSLPDFQSVYRRYSAERFGENHNTSDAREILLAAVEVILEKGITAFSANTFYDDLGKALGLSRTMNKPARTKLRDAVYRAMEKTGTVDTSVQMPFVRFLNCVETAVTTGYIPLDGARSRSVLDCIERVRTGQFPLTEKEKKFLIVYAQCQGDYKSVAEKLRSSRSLVSVNFRHISAKLGFSDINRVRRSEILSAALTRPGELETLSMEERQIIRDYITELEKTEIDILGPELRATLEAALRVVVKKGFKAGSGDIINALPADKTKKLTETQMNHRIWLIRKRLGIPTGQHRGASYMTVLDCLEYAVKNNLITYSLEQAGILQQVLDATRKKQFPFTEKEKQAFISLANCRGSYEDAAAQLASTEQAVKNSYERGLRKLYGAGRDISDVVMSAALKKALNEDNLGILSARMRDEIEAGITELAAKRRNALPRLQEKVLLLQALGMTGQATYEFLAAQPDFAAEINHNSGAIRSRSVALYNSSIRSRLGVDAGDNAIAAMTQKALEREMITPVDLLDASRWAGISLADVSPEEKGSLRRAIDRVCAEFQCGAAELFTLPRVKDIKRFVLSGAGEMRVVSAAELLQRYKNAEFQSCPSLRYRLAMIKRQNERDGKAEISAEDYVAVFREFFYDRETLEQAIIRDLIRVYAALNEVVNESSLQVNSPIVRKWGENIYKDVFSMDFAGVFKSRVVNTPEYSAFKQESKAARGHSNREAIAGKSRFGSTAAVTNDPRVSGRKPAASMVPDLQSLIDACAERQADSALLDKEVCRLCDAFEDYRSVTDSAELDQLLSALSETREMLGELDWRGMRNRLDRRTNIRFAAFRANVESNRLAEKIEDYRARLEQDDFEEEVYNEDGDTLTGLDVFEEPVFPDDYLPRLTIMPAARALSAPLPAEQSI